MRSPVTGRLIFLLICILFVLVVLGSSDEGTGPEWSGVSHVDGRN